MVLFFFIIFLFIYFLFYSWQHHTHIHSPDIAILESKVDKGKERNSFLKKLWLPFLPKNHMGQTLGSRLAIYQVKLYLQGR